MAASSDYVKTAVMGEFRVILASGATLDFEFDLGDLNISGIRSKLNELVKIRRRGRRVSEAHGEKADPTLSFTCWGANFVGADNVPPGTELEALLGVGAYESEDSTSGADRPYTVDLRFKIRGASFGDAFDETVLLEDCYLEGSFAEALDGNKFSWSAEVLGNVTFTNGANPVTLSSI